MVVAADDVGNTHIVVVDHDGEVVDRTSVGASQDEVVEVLVAPDHPALDLILNDGLALEARAQADDRLHARRRFAGIAVAPAPVIEPRAALGARLLPHLLQLLRARVAVIGMPAGQQLRGDLPVALGARKLRNGLAVPGQLKPFEPVDDRRDRGVGRALAIRVFDPQQHLAAAPARIEPVEQRRAGSADMQEPGRRGGKSRNDSHPTSSARVRDKAVRASHNPLCSSNRHHGADVTP